MSGTQSVRFGSRITELPQSVSPKNTHSNRLGIKEAKEAKEAYLKELGANIGLRKLVHPGSRRGFGRGS